VVALVPWQSRDLRQLLRFSVVGSVGFAVNLGVYALLLRMHVAPVSAAALAFVVAVTHNYVLNRVWTFREERAAFFAQGFRFLVVSLTALGVNLLLLAALLAVVGRIPAQALAIAFVMPVGFIGNKCWSFRRGRGGAWSSRESGPALFVGPAGGCRAGIESAAARASGSGTASAQAKWMDVLEEMRSLLLQATTSSGASAASACAPAPYYEVPTPETPATGWMETLDEMRRLLSRFVEEPRQAGLFRRFFQSDKIRGVTRFHPGADDTILLVRVGAFAGLVVMFSLVLQSPAAFVDELLTTLFVGLTVAGTTTLLWMLYAWRNDESLEAIRFPHSERETVHSFSLIVPARHEERVLAATLRRLGEQEHTRFEVLVVVGDDDPGTYAVASAAIAGDDRFRIVVDASERKSKPKALNTALQHCAGDVVGVFDAEDQVAPGLLRAVDQRFQETEAQVVQAATQLVNFDSSWFSVRNVLEYYFWFKSRLHFQASAGFIPLGGNTVFVDRSWLRRVGGWDPDCLAEDCDLGSRLSSIGARTVVAYSAELATLEETPESVKALVRQRTRWDQGYLQVLKKGEWRRLPLRSRVLAGYTLSFPFVQAATGLVLPIAIVIAVLKPPILLALVSFLPIVPLAGILVAELLGLGEFGREFAVRPRARDYARLVLGLPPYQFLLALAAIKAVYREARGIRNWEKTAHVGAHL
jgi:putative flippase GtrA